MVVLKFSLLLFFPQSICLLAPGVNALVREYVQIHPNGSPGETKVIIEACVGFFFHHTSQRQLFCYFLVFWLELRTSELI